MKVKIRKWDGVAVWKWDTRAALLQQGQSLNTGASAAAAATGTTVTAAGDEDNDEDDDDDVCGICRAAFDGCCPDCRVPGDECAIIIGECKHVFHMHCLFKWIHSDQSKNNCPMCRMAWKVLAQ
ncbi:anaphase-promoting complex subunit 11 [Chytriomyces sp. MP71]|nr:anaphase-promoting complex subunit 11 [Chytriomyces sp. MP71]